MRKWIVPVLVLCLAATVLVLFLSPRPPASSPPPASTAAASSNFESTSASAPIPPTTTARSNPLAIPVVSAYVAPTQAPPATVPALPADLLNIAPMTVLENMRTTFHQYASLFGGNPVGTNQEITRALLGDNPKHINFLLKTDGNRVNSNGELVDLWGTPYFFHQLSGTLMEIHSAGPDRRMWTDDDLVIR